jgi:hypothetical protein
MLIIFFPLYSYNTSINLIKVALRAGGPIIIFNFSVKLIKGILVKVY